jgi:hypothetical protein
MLVIPLAQLMETPWAWMTHLAYQSVQSMVTQWVVMMD